MNPVVKYFSEEKAESILFIIAGVIASAIALLFFFGLKTFLRKGLPFLWHWWQCWSSPWVSAFLSVAPKT